MERKNKYDILKRETSNMAVLWKNSRGIAPDTVADKLDDAMLSWMVELTDTLKIWIDKGIFMTDGELILARTNMGALVESWLKFFYCVYYEDYIKNPHIVKGKTIEPNKMKFDDLKNFSQGILWENNQAPMYLWVNKIQYYRNSVHAFNYREIGTAIEFVSDIDEFYEFVMLILRHLPPIEDYMSYYPDGYEPISHWD